MVENKYISCNPSNGQTVPQKRVGKKREGQSLKRREKNSPSKKRKEQFLKEERRTARPQRRVGKFHLNDPY